MNRIRIVYLVPDLGMAGLQNQVVNLVNRLPSPRFGCQIVSFSSYAPMRDRVQGEWGTVVTLQKRRGNDPAVVSQLYRLCRRVRPHVVQTHNWGTLVEGVVAARLAGVPIVIHAERGTVETRTRNLLMQRLMSYFVTQILCVSEAHRQRLVQAGGFPIHKIQAISNGVDTDRFSPHTRPKATIRGRIGLEPTAFYIGSVGNLRPVKNQRLLLRACATLSRRYPDVHLLLVGDGPMREPLERLAAELGIQKRVQFLGTRADVPEVLNALDVFVLPSLSEGMPNAVLEAMACALPVVATRVGGIPEIIEDGSTGLLFHPEDEARLTVILEELMQHEVKRQLLGAQGHKHILENFSLERMMQNYQMLYESIAEGYLT